MGSKATSTANKNMMSAPGEEYLYVYDETHSKKLLGASVTTWTNNNYFREYDSGSSLYTSQTYTNTWLPYQTYSIKSPTVQENGTIADSYTVAFSYTSAPNAKWVKTSEAELYDHYSHLLQVKDINGRSSSIKYAHNNSFPMGAVQNANYKSWCFSGAEEASDGAFYEGEVYSSGTRVQSSTYAHTGDYSTRLSYGAIGFGYRINIADLPAGGKYRASVWVHQNGAAGAALRCDAYNSGNSFVANYGVLSQGVSVTNPTMTIYAAGSWRQYNLDIDVANISGSASYILFELRNNVSAVVYADDFRVYPLNSPFTATVYNPKNGKVLATLDKDNYATKYFYDDGGKLKTVYKETAQGFKKVSETAYNYGK
jgi:uncharacterized membrane protein